MFKKKSNAETKNNKTALSTQREVGLTTPGTTEKLIRIIGEVDKPFLVLVLVLVGIGIIAVASASYSYAEMTQGDSYFFTVRHVRYALGGVAAMFFVSFVDYRVYKKLYKLILVIGFGLCLLILTPLKHTSGGATRWLDFGIVTFQPSEVLKFSVVVACAAYASNAKEKIKGIKCILFYGLLLGACVITLAIQPHISCIIIICMLIACMMVMGGVRWIYIGSCGALVGVAGSVFVTMFPHALSRLAVWFNPFDPLYFKNDGWQPAQSLFAIASGGVWGVGLGQSNQKDGYIPEPQNDYIFSVICEEMGFVGAVAIMILFAALVWRGMYIAKKAPTVFSGLLTAGIICQVGIQTLLNIAVVSNTLPSTGISLPFLSSGGTSLVILLCQMGVVLSVSRHSIVERG